MKDKFHQISITGRYIYCYFCLKKAIDSKSLKDLPEFLNIILKSFTTSPELDIWQDRADEVLPSVILDQENGIDRFKAISNEEVMVLRDYYSQNELVANLVESLIWLGMSNLYGGFDSKITFEYVTDVISLMNDNRIDLPDFSIVSSFSVDERGGWGDLVDIDHLQ